MYQLSHLYRCPSLSFYERYMDWRDGANNKDRVSDRQSFRTAY